MKAKRIYSQVIWICISGLIIAALAFGVSKRLINYYSVSETQKTDADWQEEYAQFASEYDMLQGNLYSYQEEDRLVSVHIPEKVFTTILTTCVQQTDVLSVELIQPGTVVFKAYDGHQSLAQIQADFQETVSGNILVMQLSDFKSGRMRTPLSENSPLAVKYEILSFDLTPTLPDWMNLSAVSMDSTGAVLQMEISYSRLRTFLNQFISMQDPLLAEILSEEAGMELFWDDVAQQEVSVALIQDFLRGIFHVSSSRQRVAQIVSSFREEAYNQCFSWAQTFEDSGFASLILQSRRTLHAKACQMIAEYYNTLIQNEFRSERMHASQKYVYQCSGQFVCDDAWIQDHLPLDTRLHNYIRLRVYYDESRFDNGPVFLFQDYEEESIYYAVSDQGGQLISSLVVADELAEKYPGYTLPTSHASREKTASWLFQNQAADLLLDLHKASQLNVHYLAKSDSAAVVIYSVDKRPTLYGTYLTCQDGLWQIEEDEIGLYTSFVKSQKARALEEGIDYSLFPDEEYVSYQKQFASNDQLQQSIKSLRSQHLIGAHSYFTYYCYMNDCLYYETNDGVSGVQLNHTVTEPYFIRRLPNSH